MDTPRDILHVDMDAFFASVERILDPSLTGKPVIVGGRVEDRSVVSSASYEARRYGVRSAMPIAQARRLCPNGVFLQGHYEAYSEFSRRTFHILRQFTPVIERMSLDDFYLDLTGCRRLHGHPLDAADRIKRTVFSETQLPVSVGAGSSKLVAKVASGQAKPNGVLFVAPGGEAAFFRNLPLRKLPGIGASTAERLGKFNLSTLGEVAALPKKQLEQLFGTHGTALWERCLGRDDSPVVADPGLPKSIGRERTFAQDTTDHGAIRALLHMLTEKTARQLREEGLVARRVTVKVRYADFQTATRRGHARQRHGPRRGVL